MSILSLYISLGKRGQNGRAGLGSNLANRGQKIQERWVHSLAWIQMLSYLDETICAFLLSVGFFFFLLGESAFSMILSLPFIDVIYT